MKRKDLTALTFAALVATSPTFAAPQGIPATVETTDFTAANADFPIVADPASEQPTLSENATDREAKPSSRGSAGPERPAAPASEQPILSATATDREAKPSSRGSAGPAAPEDFRNRAPVRENVGPQFSTAPATAETNRRRSNRNRNRRPTNSRADSADASPTKSPSGSSAPSTNASTRSAPSSKRSVAAGR